MPPDPPPQRTQEQSIRARKHQLFESDDLADHGPRSTFPELVRQTPAAPLSPVIKGALWTVGALVILLLIAALATSGNRKPRPKPVAIWTVPADHQTA